MRHVSLRATDEAAWHLESGDLLTGLLQDAGAAVASLPSDHPIRAIEPRLREVQSEGAPAEGSDLSPVAIADRLVSRRQVLSELILALDRFGANLPERGAIEARIAAYLRHNVSRLS